MNKKEFTAVVKSVKEVVDSEGLTKEQLVAELLKREYSQEDADIIAGAVFVKDNSLVTDDLRQHMANSPNKGRVWVNDRGEWCNHSRPDFPNELTREDILG